ncbi:MAG: M48 metallopeptidase family protein [Thermoanaerobaculia bacterium]
MKKRRHRRSARSERLLGEIEGWATKLGIEPEAVYVQRMKRKWASCSSAGRLYFASDLAGEPRRFREVVIVHELLHLRIQNHGKLFKSFLNSYVPGWEIEIQGKANRICR